MQGGPWGTRRNWVSILTKGPRGSIKLQAGEKPKQILKTNHVAIACLEGVGARRPPGGPGGAQERINSVYPLHSYSHFKTQPRHPQKPESPRHSRLAQTLYAVHIPMSVPLTGLWAQTGQGLNLVELRVGSQEIKHSVLIRSTEWQHTTLFYFIILFFTYIFKRFYP